MNNRAFTIKSISIQTEFFSPASYLTEEEPTFPIRSRQGEIDTLRRLLTANQTRLSYYALLLLRTEEEKVPQFSREELILFSSSQYSSHLGNCSNKAKYLKMLYLFSCSNFFF